MPKARVSTTNASSSFLQEGMDRLQTVPGVRAATVSMPTLLSGGTNGTGMFVQGRAYPAGRAARDASATTSTASSSRRIIFETMGIPLVAGRDFTERDHAKRAESRHHQPGGRAKILSRTRIRSAGASEIRQKTSGDIEIVGVLRDVRYNSLREPPPPTLYVPYLQRGPDDLSSPCGRPAIRPALMPAIRRAVSAINPDIPIVTIETQMSQIERRFAQEKVLAQAYALFGGIALFVAAIGLFGLMSYNVSRRTREIGIRMAMGAQRERCSAWSLRESMLLVVAGIVIGIGIVHRGRRIWSRRSCSASSRPTPRRCCLRCA